MGWTDRPGRWSPAVRWMLLAAVLTGLFGMHVLTAEDGASRHGVLQVGTMVGHDDVSGRSPSPAETTPEAMDAAGTVATIGSVVTPADPGAGGHQGAMAACVLFLVVGGAALILLLRHRVARGMTGLGRFAGIAVTDMSRRGPPGRWPRLALCVIRV